MRQRLKRILAGSSVVLGLTAALGALGQLWASRSWRLNNPPPGEMVDIGTHSLHWHCTGQGAPTVVFNSGAGSGSPTWAELQGSLAEHTRVCSYDRAGFGWSQAGPMPRTAERVASELLALLDAAGETEPVVLVGHSLGGFQVRLLAAEHPERVAGLVLVDATIPVRPVHLPVPTWAESKWYDLKFEALGAMARVAVRLGAVRLLVLTSGRRSDPMKQTLLEHGALTPHVDAVTSELQSLWERIDTEKENDPALGDLPLLVLVPVPGEADEIEAELQLKIDSHQAVAARSSRGELRVVPHSSHNIHWDNPSALRDAIVEMIEDLSP